MTPSLALKKKRRGASNNEATGKLRFLPDPYPIKRSDKNAPGEIPWGVFMRSATHVQHSTAFTRHSLHEMRRENTNLTFERAISPTVRFRWASQDAILAQIISFAPKMRRLLELHEEVFRSMKYGTPEQSENLSNGNTDLLAKLKACDLCFVSVTVHKEKRHERPSS